MSTEARDSRKYAGLLASVSGIVLAWNLIGGIQAGPLGMFAKLPWVLLSGAATVGTHKRCGLEGQNYLDGLMYGWSCMQLGAKETGIQQAIAPSMTQLKELTGFADTHSKQSFDLSKMFTQSAVIIAPTGGGKSIFTSMVHVERHKAHPNAPFKIGTPNFGKRGQTWMGLVECPDHIQNTYLAIGNRYKDESPPKVAAFREIDDALDTLHKTYLNRLAIARDSKGKQSSFELETLTIDEFPAYFEYLQKTDAGKERLIKIRELLCEANGYRCVLWVITQSDAVNMLGLSQSQQAQLLMVYILAPGEFSKYKGCTLTNDEVEFINTKSNRRCFMSFNGRRWLMDIPECEVLGRDHETGDLMVREPEIDWTPLLQKDAHEALIEHLALNEMKGWKAEGAGLTEAWAELTNRVTWKASKRQSRNGNRLYDHFVNVYEGIEV